MFPVMRVAEPSDLAHSPLFARLVAERYVAVNDDGTAINRAGPPSRMEDLYSIHPGVLRGGDIPVIGSVSSCQVTNEASQVIGGSGVSDLTDKIKAQIANHPLYPSLLSTYIECRKSVAQESYCLALVRYKEDLSKPFDEAASFLNDIEMQLNNLCKACSSAATTAATGNSPSGKY
ncbi:hypothetical protein GW17_00041679 [Ensete ventricosum]|nr:hypothetical protein GW17_00041679 [Ensete ventricosum]